MTMNTKNQNCLLHHTLDIDVESKLAKLFCNTAGKVMKSVQVSKGVAITLTSLMS